jgi:hypothetical protein
MGSSPGAKTTQRIATLVGVLSTLSLVALGAYAWTQRSWAALAVGPIAGFGVSAVAAFAGFVFGLPHYSQAMAIPSAEGTSDAPKVASTLKGAQTAAGSFVSSNNLEQISDWLTKLLLGAGVVQLGKIGHWLGDVVESLAAGLSSPSAPVSPSARVVASGLLALFASVGFLVGYVSTTLWYRERLEAITQQLREAADRKPDSSCTRPLV